MVRCPVRCFARRRPLGERYAPVGRPSLLLRNYLTPGATRAQNRVAYQAAIDAATTQGKSLCYDGAFFEFEGAPVKSTQVDAIHWATGHDTHKVVQKTVGNGGMRMAGLRSQALNLYIDADNPTLDLSTTGSQANWHSYGILIEPTAHDSIVRNIKGGGFMRLVLATTMQPEELITRDNNFTDVTTTTHPQLRNITVDGALSVGCWTAFQPLAVDGVVIKRLAGTYKKAIGSGADPHIVYINGLGNGDTAADTKLWNYNVTLDDSLCLGGEISQAYKARSVRGFSITNCRARNSPGLFDLINVFDLQIGAGCFSMNDILPKESGKGSVSLYLVNRGSVAPISVVFSATVENAPGLGLDRCIAVEIDRPRVVANSPVDQSGYSSNGLLKLIGSNPGCRVIEPELISAGAPVHSGVISAEVTGLSGSSSDMTVYDPRVSGSVKYGLRAALKGITFLYNPDHVIATMQKVRVDVSPVMVLNRCNPVRPDLDTLIVGWHNGEALIADNVNTGVRWPDGRGQTYIRGEWRGNGKGRLSEVTGFSDHTMVAPTWPSADVDIRCRVKRGTSTRAGLVLRANAVNTYLAFVLTATNVALIKNVAGTITEILPIATVIPGAALADIRVLAVGTKIFVQLNGAQIIDHTLTGGDETTFVSAVHGVAGGGGAASNGAAWEGLVLRAIS